MLLILHPESRRHRTVNFPSLVLIFASIVGKSVVAFCFKTAVREATSEFIVAFVEEVKLEDGLHEESTGFATIEDEVLFIF